MIEYKAKVALKSYFSSFVICFLSGLFIVYMKISSLQNNIYIFLLSFTTIISLLKLIYKANDFQIAIRAALLGFAFSLGIYIKLTAPSNIQIFGGYMCVMAFFHFSEFIAIALVQPQLVSTDSFVINHSINYTVAAITSWIEFFIESYFLPGLKELRWLSNIGLCMCIAGEALRKIAILNAGSSFNHLIQNEKTSDHKLVTTGVYGWFRHPSYVGWFYWSIGTQIILVNPLCVLSYTVASWLFFKSRIFFEEITLLNFFGQNYVDYQKKVGTGLPFIKGYQI